MKFLIRLIRSFLLVVKYGPDEVMGALMYDALTGVYTRRHIEETARKAIAQGLRYGRPISLAVVDFDHFKQVNDRHGHAAGDCLLKGFGEQCKQGLRSADSVGRIGGDEFLVVLPETTPETASVVLPRLQKQCRENDMPISFGVACALPEDTFEEVFDRADAAMYVNKRIRRAT